MYIATIGCRCRPTAIVASVVLANEVHYFTPTATWLLDSRHVIWVGTVSLIASLITCWLFVTHKFVIVRAVCSQSSVGVRYYEICGASSRTHTAELLLIMVLACQWHSQTVIVRGASIHLAIR